MQASITAQLANLAQELQNERARLVGRTTWSNVTFASNEPGDEGDQAKIHEDREAYSISEYVRQNQVQMIDQTLQRIALGTYGVCQECNRPIDPARLEALPCALYCVACQTKKERKNRIPKPCAAYPN